MNQIYHRPVVVIDGVRYFIDEPKNSLIGVMNPENKIVFIGAAAMVETYVMPKAEIVVNGITGKVMEFDVKGRDHPHRPYKLRNTNPGEYEEYASPNKHAVYE